MGRRWWFWPLAGFLTAAVLGTLAHFAYRWSGGALLAGVFCAVNESVWEHMKLLFFPVFLFTAAQFCVGERDGLLAARAVSVTAGLALIPTLYYTASPSAAALEDGMPGGGTGVAVGAGISVCLVDLFTAPHRPVPGPSDGTLRDTVEKRRCPFGTAPSLLFLVEVEITAIPAGPQCLGASETDFFQITEGVIVTFAEKTADFRTAA